MCSDYTVLHQTPTVTEYCQLRLAAGLSGKTESAAARALPNSLFAVQLRSAGELLAMGRVIGDGGCFYQVVDIAVLPAWQGRGLGKRVMQEIMQYISQHAPTSAYVSLIADGQAQHMYAGFGFVPTAPRSVGMAYKVSL